MRCSVTNPCLWLAGLLALAVSIPGPAAAQKKEKRRGFLLQLADEKGLLPQPPVVTLRGNLGTTRTTTPKDDGVSPDVKAADRLYVQPVPTFFDPKVKIQVRAGNKLWNAEAVFKPTDVRARVIIILEPGGKTQVNIHSDAAPPPNVAPPRPPGPGPRTKQAEFITQDEVSFSSKLGIGFVLWVLAFLLFAASLALIRLSRRGQDSPTDDEDDDEDDEDTFDDVEDEDDAAGE